MNLEHKVITRLSNSQSAPEVSLGASANVPIPVINWFSITMQHTAPAPSVMTGTPLNMGCCWFLSKQSSSDDLNFMFSGKGRALYFTPYQPLLPNPVRLAKYSEPDGMILSAQGASFLSQMEGISCTYTSVLFTPQHETLLNNIWEGSTVIGQQSIIQFHNPFNMVPAESWPGDTYQLYFEIQRLVANHSMGCIEQKNPEDTETSQPTTLFYIDDNGVIDKIVMTSPSDGKTLVFKAD